MAEPVPAPVAAQPPSPAPVHQGQGPEAQKLHKLALDAQGNLEQLATGLAQAHADPGAVKAVSSMASVMRRILTALAKAAQAEQPAATAAPPAQQPQTMDTATNALQAALAAKRQGGSPQ